MTQEIQFVTLQELEKEVKLYINEMLYKQGYITQRLFLATKQELLRH